MIIKDISINNFRKEDAYLLVSIDDTTLILDKKCCDKTSDLEHI